MTHLRWVGLALVAAASACDLLSVAPSSGGAGLRLSLDVIGASYGQVEGIVSEVDQLTVTFTRPDGGARDTTVSIQHTTTGIRARVRLLPEELVDGLEIRAALGQGGAEYYAGTAEVDAGGGVPPTATVVMRPLTGRVVVSPSSASFDAIGDTLRLKAAVLFPGTNDTVPGLSPTWSSHDSAIVAVTPDGLATTRGNGDVVLDASYGDSTARVSIHVEQFATSLTIVPDTATLVAGSTARFELTAFDRLGTPLANSLTPGLWVSTSASGILALSFSGLSLALAEGSVTVTANLDNAWDTALVNVTAPNGPLLVVADSDGIRFGDLGGNRTAIVVSGRTSQPTWSADRTHFAYVLDGQLWVSDLDGNANRLGVDSAVAWPEYSADGSFIYYGSGSDIYRIHPDGSGRQLVVQNGYMPTTSPDGSLIAWVSGDSLMVQAIGGSPEAVDVTGEKGTPVWSPDGQWIAFPSGATKVVTVIHPDGTGRRQIPGTSFSDGISWSPDGQWLFGFDTDKYPTVVDVADGRIIGFALAADQTGPWWALQPSTAAWWR